MSSKPYVCAVIPALLCTLANMAACSTGCMRRQRKIMGASFVQALVFGFLANPRMAP